MAEAAKPKKATKTERGRPTLYTRELADEICQRIAEGETLTGICSGPDMPSKAAVLLWVRDNRDGFSDRYAHARDLQLEGIADEMLDLADDARNDWMERQSGEGTITVVDHEHVARTKLRLETRKWLLVKLKPQRYGDKIEQTHKGDDAFLALWQGMAGGKPKGD
jgi:hypothetical protein